MFWYKINAWEVYYERPTDGMGVGTYHSPILS